MSRLALGTVQFGVDYGINNPRGIVPEEEVFAILEKAHASGIDTLDTSAGYGKSESVIGQYIQKSKNNFFVVSKVFNCDASGVARQFDASLKNFDLETVYGCLVHNFKDYRDDLLLWQELKKLKVQGRVQRIGFSLYYPEELEKLLEERVKFDLLQVPYNVFDRRFEKYFEKLKERGVEVHVRSVFLQGLVFKKAYDLNIHFAGIREKLVRLDRIAQEHDLSIVDLCLNFVLANQSVDRVIVGVDSLGQLEEIIAAEQRFDRVFGLLGELAPLSESDEKIILPFNWPKERVAV